MSSDRRFSRWMNFSRRNPERISQSGLSRVSVATRRPVDATRFGYFIITLPHSHPLPHAELWGVMNLCSKYNGTLKVRYCEDGVLIVYMERGVAKREQLIVLGRKTVIIYSVSPYSVNWFRSSFHVDDVYQSWWRATVLVWCNSGSRNVMETLATSHNHQISIQLSIWFGRRSWKNNPAAGSTTTINCHTTRQCYSSGMIAFHLLVESMPRRVVSA